MVFSFGKSKLEVRLGDSLSLLAILGWRVRLCRALCRIALWICFILQMICDVTAGAWGKKF